MRESCCSTQCKAKGDHHARQVLKLDDNGRHCRRRCQRHHQCHQFGVRHTGVGSGASGLRHGASPSISGTPYRFIERLVVTDSHKIDTLLAIPI